MGWPTRRVPLAWKNLTHRKVRFVVAVAGITFAVLLMFVQFGFWAALFDSNTHLVRLLNGELVIVHRGKNALMVKQPFSRRRIEQARAVDGVRAVYPIYMEMMSSLWKNPLNEAGGEFTPGASNSKDPTSDESHTRPIRVVAFDPEAAVLSIPECRTHEAELKLPKTALVDANSRPFFRISPAATEPTRELALKNLRIVGHFDLGTDFTNDGNLIMSDSNFAHYFPSPIPGESPLSYVEIGLVQLAPGADAAQVKAALAQALPEDVKVLTREEFVGLEEGFWQTNTPVGYVFGLGAIMGVIVGIIICYQILSADVTDHLPEFATLKAIGYADNYLTRVVLQEALFISGLGFVPGFLLTLVAYNQLAVQTQLPMHMTIPRALLVLTLAAGMCVFSGLLVVRKVKLADPAEVFR
jgi:putative ABC transport system permease protein